MIRSLGVMACVVIFATSPILADEKTTVAADGIGDKAKLDLQGWTDIFSQEPWYKDQPGTEIEFGGELKADPAGDGPSTLMRSSHYLLGNWRVWTSTKKIAFLDGLVGKKVVFRGKKYEINLEGNDLHEIWPAAVRPARDGEKLNLPEPKNAAGAMAAAPDIAAPAKKPVPNPADTRKNGTFSLVFKYGVDAKNVLDTGKGTYTRDMVNEPAATIPLKLTTDDIASIRAKMDEIGFFEMPATMEPAKPTVEPGGQAMPRLQTQTIMTQFAVKNDGRTKEIRTISLGGLQDEKAKKLQSLSDLIIRIIESKDEFRKMPQPKSGYL